MSAQFTPGPWEADRTCVRNVGREHRFTAGLTRTAYASADEMLANASLIAAAPELFEALIEGVAIEEGDLTGIEWKMAVKAWLSKANAALSKARGEPA